MTTNRLILALVAFLAIGVIAIVVASAIGQDRLWSLIGGVAVLGAILILAGWVIARNIVVPLLDAKTKREAMHYDFLQGMAAKGALPNDGSFIPLHQLEAPADMPVSLQGITAEQLAEFKVHAVNLLALSKQVMGDTSGQVVPFYKAKENDYFRDVAIWTNGVRYLIANQMAREVYKEGKSGRRKVGTFLNAGTVAQAFDVLNRG